MRKGQFFIIAAVIIILNLLAIGGLLRKGYVGSSERPSSELSSASEFNYTISKLYNHPYSFKRNIESFQVAVRTSSGFSSQIYIYCGGEADCERFFVGKCLSSECTSTIRIEGSGMKISSDYTAVMGS